MRETFDPVYAWYVVGVLTLAYTFSFIDRQILSLLVEPIRHDLQLTDTQIGLLQGLAFAIFYTTLGVPFGRLADRTSRRAIICGGILVWSAMTAACGLARSFGVLFGFRVGVGVGEAALNPAAYSLITDYFPRDQVTRAIAVYTGGSFLGAGLALIIGGAVIDLVAGIGSVTLPVLGDLRPWQVAFVAVGVPGVAVAALMLTIREPARRGLIRSSGGAQAGVAIPEIVAFLKSHRAAYGFHFAGFSAIVLLAYANLAWVPTYFTRTFGWTAGEVGLRYGLVILIFGTAGVVSGGWLADLLRRRGYRDANLRLVVITSLALLPLGVASTLMPESWMALALSAPAAYLWAVPMGVAPAALQPITPNQMRAQISALYLLTITLVGLGVGPLLVALLTDRVFGDPQGIKYSLAIVSAGAAPLAALLLRLGMPAYRRSLEAAERGWQ